MSTKTTITATLQAELEAERRRTDRAEADKRLLEHRIRDEIAWLQSRAFYTRAEVLAGWIGGESDD